MKSRNDVSGQSIVEMAVTIPFLILLVLAIFEMAQVFFTYIALINATREGGIYASLHPQLSNPAKAPEDSALYRDYVERVKGEALAAGLAMSFFTIERPVAPQIAVLQPITVTARYHLKTFSSTLSLPIFGRMGLPDHYEISHSAVFPIRQVP